MQKKLFCIAGLPTLPDGLTRDFLECNSNNECPRRLGKCHFMFSQTPSGKNGFCVPSTCQSNVECPSFGDECTSGRLSGNSFHSSTNSPNHQNKTRQNQSILFFQEVAMLLVTLVNTTQFYLLLFVVSKF